MKKVLKRTLAVFLAVIMTMGVASLDGLVSLDLLEFGSKASAATISSYTQGDIIEFGWYPQSEVIDASIISALNSADGEWKSYGYYSGTGSEFDGQMKPGDYMRYKDVMYGSDKYRGVVFDYYRPISTYLETSSSTFQHKNGYYVNTVYWFKYEPIKWRVLNPATGMVMAETILDSQAYNNYILRLGVDEYGRSAYWGDSSKTYYSNNYAKSSIREWLNKDFYNTAFSTPQQNIIEYTALDNSACDDCSSAYGSETTYDKIYLFSYDDLMNPNYDFGVLDEYNSKLVTRGSDYAKCQGLYVEATHDRYNNYIEYSTYTLRSAGDTSCEIVVSYNTGYLDCIFFIEESFNTIRGIRPVLNLNLNSEIIQSDVKDTGEPSPSVDIIDPDSVFPNAEFTQTHVINNYQTKNNIYLNEYFDGTGYPLDGSNGTPDMCIPGLSKEDDMVPQGITYYSDKNQILVSAYSSDGCVIVNRPSVIYALDYDTGKYIAEYKIYNTDDTPHKGHVGGIAVSENNLYITTDNGTISYIPLSELNAPEGKSKKINIFDSYIVPGFLKGASTSHLSYSDGYLWTGNFYHTEKKFKYPASGSNNSLVLGFSLNGANSKNEWDELKKKVSADFTFAIPNSISKIQGAAVSLSDNKMILISSYGRTKLSTMYTINISDNNITNADIKSVTGIPMLEGVFIRGNYIYTVTESASWFYNGYNPNNLSKDPTDVIWKIKISNDISDATSITKTINYAVDGVSGSVDVTFKDSWFAKENRTYNHELARFCADYVMMGYCYDKEEIEKYLSHMRFDTVDSCMDAGRNEVNYFIASKDITVNGKTETLVFAAFIGSYKDQWYSNFDPYATERGERWEKRNAPYADETEKGIVHLGFADAREYVYARLEDFITDNNIDKENMKLLISGHSRGAATANLLAAKLIDESYSNSITEIVSKENIYTYTFATPNNASTQKNVFDYKYKSIFNIVNPEDFVTKVLLNDWGFYRYGTTYILPSKTNDTYYKTYLTNMRPLFKSFCGETYDPYKMGEVKTSKIIKSIYKNIGSLDELYEDEFIYYWSITDGVANIKGDVGYESPFTFFKQTLLKYLVDKDMSEILRVFLPCSWFYKNVLQFFAWPDITIEEIIGAFESQKDVMFDVKPGGKFDHAHRMVTYAAYMNSLTSTQLKQPRLYYKNTVNCPVDIEVYDKATNELVGKIKNNVIDETIAEKENAIVVDVDGDSKSFYLPSNGDYRVVLTGNDDGTMDYTVSNIDSDTGETERINFFDVEIENGVSMEGEINAEEFVIDEYTLNHEENGTIEPTEKLAGDSLCDISIIVTTEGMGYSDGDVTVTSGDYVTITATTNEGNDFIGWYENDILVSSDAEYSFVAKENRNLVAKFTSRYVIQWNIEGEAIVTYCEAGDKINSPAVPVKEGYVFSGWVPEIPDGMPDENLVFNGTWIPVECKLSFDATTGSWADGTTKKTDIVDFNSEIVVPEVPSKPGYIFLGWSLENVNLGTDLGVMDDVNGKAFKAVWVASTDTRYAVETYTMNTEGKYVKTIQNFTGETDSTVNAEYVIEEGFTLNDEMSVLSGTITADNSLVLKLYIDRNVYTFTTVVDGVSTPKSYLYGSTVPEPVTPSKPGYKFIKWNGTIPQTMPAENVTVTAVFEKSYICPECGKEILGDDAINKHIASETKVNIDGGNIVSGVVSPGATITVSAPQINGKIFNHWEVTNATVADADSAETTIVLGSGKISITAVYDDCDCKCHQGGISGFFFKITLFFQKLFGKNLECICGAKH